MRKIYNKDKFFNGDKVLNDDKFTKRLTYNKDKFVTKSFQQGIIYIEIKFTTRIKFQQY